MGIRGLETFVKTKVENGTCIFDMAKLIKYQKEATGKEVLIVIDLDSMKNHCCVAPQHMLCGMRSDVYSRKIREFLNKLVEAGAVLVFFTDGPPQVDKHTTWMDRQNTKYEDALVMIAKLEKFTPLREILKEELPSTAIISPLLEDIAKQFGSLHKSIDNECDLELAAYATENNAFAILADDSDFLIYPGDWRYWSIKSIDTEQLTTLAYNRAALRSHLALSPLQMPVFAALGGNDIVQYELIKGFHQRIAGWKDKFVNIAHYVRPLPLNFTEKNENLETVAKDVFSHRSDWRKFKELFKSGVDIYDYKAMKTLELPPLQKKLLDNHQEHVYTILKEIPFTITTLFEDLRDTTKQSYPNLALNLRAKIVGVILQHRKDMNLQMKIVLKMTHEEPYRQINVMPIYPESDVPSIERLVLPEKNDGLDSTRKELLTWVLTGTRNISINTDQLFALPKDFILSVATLFYLVKEGNFSLEMADIVLLSIHYSSTIKDAPQPEYLLKDAFTATFSYLKMYNFIGRIFKILGLREYVSLLRFDGFLFHKLHQESPLWDATTRSNWMLPIANLRLYAV